MSLSNKTLETWTWRLIFGGLIVFGLGLAVGGRDASLGTVIAATGVVVAIVGAGMVWVRSRRGPGDGA